MRTFRRLLAQPAQPGQHTDTAAVSTTDSPIPDGNADQVANCRAHRCHNDSASWPIADPAADTVPASRLGLQLAAARG